MIIENMFKQSENLKPKHINANHVESTLSNLS
jgi:hypothetical protein